MELYMRAAFALILCFFSSDIYAHGFSPDIIERAQTNAVGISLQSFDSRIPPFENRDMRIRGTGFVFREKYVITNFHVVRIRFADEALKESPDLAKPLKEVSVLDYQKKLYTAQLVGWDESLDIAVYELPLGETLPSVGRMQKKKAFLGSDVFVVGYPYNLHEQIINYGHVGNTAIWFPASAAELLQLDVFTCSGNSGGAVFGTDGEFVGLITYAIPVLTDSDLGVWCSKYMFATQADVVLKVVEEIILYGRVRDRWVGIQVGHQKYENRWVASVDAVDPKGPSMQRLQKGDLIISINSKPIRYTHDIKKLLLEETHPGETLIFQIIRNGQGMYRSVTVRDRGIRN